LQPVHSSSPVLPNQVIQPNYLATPAVNTNVGPFTFGGSALGMNLPGMNYPVSTNSFGINDVGINNFNMNNIDMGTFGTNSVGMGTFDMTTLGTSGDSTLGSVWDGLNLDPDVDLTAFDLGENKWKYPAQYDQLNATQAGSENLPNPFGGQ
jgi:hypothetical protein